MICIRPALGWSVALVACLLTVLPASGNDLLEQVRRQREVKAQRLEADVTDTLAAARKADATSAADLLKGLLARVESDDSLTPTRRESLVRRINEQIRALGATARDDRAADTEAGRKMMKDRTSAQDAIKAREADVINAKLRNIDALKKAGRYAEANRASRELAQDYPNHPAAQASGATSSTTDQVADARGIAGSKADKTNRIMREIDRDSEPMAGEVRFPKDWAERSKKREKFVGQRLTEKEQSILKALNSSINVDYKNEPFGKVIEDIATKLGHPILLDKTALENAQVNTSESPVTLRLPGASARTVLRKILKDFNLAYIIKDEAIQVVSEQTAKETMVTRTYYLGDLLTWGPLMDNPNTRFMPGATQLQAAQNAANIIKIIQEKVERDTWDANGGKGSIVYNGATLSLIITAPTEVHGALNSSLR